MHLTDIIVPFCGFHLFAYTVNAKLKTKNLKIVSWKQKRKFIKIDFISEVNMVEVNGKQSKKLLKVGKSDIPWQCVVLLITMYATKENEEDNSKSQISGCAVEEQFILQIAE